MNGRHFLAILTLALAAIQPTFSQTSGSDRGVGVQAGTPAAIPDAKRNWGVFIGVNEFKSKGVPSLKFCVSDAQALHTELTGADALVPPTQSYLLTSERTGADAPDKLNILKAIKYACDHAQLDSLLVISIATHGFTGTDGKSYILPADGDPELLSDTAISVERINEMLAKSKATKKLLIVDACRERSGMDTRGVAEAQMSDAFVRALKSAAGQVTLAACGAGEMAHEDNSARHGVFTRFLVEGLKGNAAKNADGFISVYTLSQYAVKKTREWCSANRLPAQTPWLAGEMSFDIPLAVPGRVGEVMAIASAPASVPTEPRPSVGGTSSAPVKTTTESEMKWDELKEMLAKKEYPKERQLTYYRAFASDHAGTRAGQEASETADRLGSDLQQAQEAQREAAKRAEQNRLRLSQATKDNPWVNSLGMKFVPVPETKVLFCIWETRVKDYHAYVEANSGVDGSWRNPGFNQTDDHPVVNVRWEDAKAFCAWLSKKEGCEYRLATDAEWSVAVGVNEAAGGAPNSKDEKTPGVYPWGTGWPPPRGAGNYFSSLNTDTFANTSPVGSFAANRHGLYDLGGNVWEWCEDYYDGQSGSRVLRGASWSNGDSRFLLSSCRDFCDPDYRIYGFGFRCVVVVGSAAR